MTDAKDKYPILFSPFDLGPTRLRNRTVIPGHSMALSRFEPGISDRYRAYLVTRAKGGAALVGIESAPMHETTQNAFSSATVITDKAIPSLAKTAEEVHAAGAALSIILWHGGHNIPHRGGAPPLAAGRRALPDALQKPARGCCRPPKRTRASFRRNSWQKMIKLRDYKRT